MNAGERAELKSIAILSCFRGKEINIHGNKILVNTIDIPVKKTCNAIPLFAGNINPNHIESLTDQEFDLFCNVNKIKKAEGLAKADVYINKVGYSVKYTGSAPPAIVNHTARPGWENVANFTGVNIADLDKLVDEYWRKRKAGIIAEDISNSNPDSPFANNLNTLLPYIEFFSFTGTGSKKSDHPAAKVIEFSDPCNINTWKMVTQANFVKSVWPRLVFSVRSKKGMPKDIDKVKDVTKRNSIKRWSEDFQGDLRGALHVRVG
jgi:hypothetical protein